MKISHRDIAVCEKLAPDFEKLPNILVIGQLKEWGWGGILFLYFHLDFVFDYNYRHLCLLSERGWRVVERIELEKTYSKIK